MAQTYVHRGNAKAQTEGQGPVAALEDLDQAIALWEGLRKALETRGNWEPRFGEGLAWAYTSRGNARRVAVYNDPFAALSDYDRAIAIVEAMRKVQH